MTASRLAIRAADWASGLAFWSPMNRSLLPSAVASPWQTLDSAADSAADCAAFDVVAMAKAPPPATAAAVTNSATFFFALRVLLRDMRASCSRRAFGSATGSDEYAAMYEMSNEATQRSQRALK